MLGIPKFFENDIGHVLISGIHVNGRRIHYIFERKDNKKLPAHLLGKVLEAPELL